ncbi:O-methyltransferase [Egicoccus halophilus]|uniref:O-methyltransferase n=1 Tax=Egicoccus halophilus TaxID=1670830 RepID=A0A8J3A853_9ACTN|nr:O-methyltransferase [Egicoccus halophilus]GGI06117.1 O-methyltransferase [Egicoccus halophilus]
MARLLPDEVDDYLTGLAGIGLTDPVLEEMEARAREHRFPIVGRAVGRHLELQARAVGARRVMELGSGYGYSAYFFARAVGEDGEVVCTDGDPDNAARAEGYLRRAGLWDRVDYHVGDALTSFAGVEGEFDVVYCDVDKDGYPDAWEAARDRVRVGGLWICDNTLWGGRVAGVPAEPDEFRDRVTPDIVAMTRAVAEDERYVSSLVPLRDGVLVALRVA